MAYNWTEDWATGNNMIDTQHKQLFKAINDLLEACQGGKGRTQLDKTMLFLTDYTIKHFGEEEQLQKQYKYLDYPNHKKLHDDFKASMADLAKQLREQGPTIALVSKANSSLGGWLVKHIQQEDKKLAAHIKAQQGK